MGRTPAIAGVILFALSTSAVGAPAVNAFAPAQAQAPTPMVDVSRELMEAARLMEQKDWRGALVELKAALRKERRNPDVYNLMGYCYRKSGQLDDALDSYRVALRLDPRHRIAHEYIGEAYLNNREPDKARQHLAALRELCGVNCEEYRDLSKALTDYQSAVTAVK